MPLPAIVNLTAYHGDTWVQTFRLKYGAVPVDLTGATAAASAQPRSGALVPLTATILDATAGEVQLGIDPGAGLPSNSYTYDLEIRQGAIVTTWVRGTLTVTADITNPLVAV